MGVDLQGVEVGAAVVSAGAATFMAWLAGRNSEVDDLSRAIWRTSILSSANGCAEVSLDGVGNAVWGSKDHRQGPVLRFTAPEWAAFVGGVQGGEFDLPARSWCAGRGQPPPGSSHGDAWHSAGVIHVTAPRPGAAHPGR